MSDRKFPILFAYREREEIALLRKRGSPYLVVCLPWDMLAPHERQAINNHGQTLERLADRGGLDVGEALAILEDRPYRTMSPVNAHEALVRAMMAWAEKEAGK